MAIMPDTLRLSPVQELTLASIRAEAVRRHEKARKAAKARGREHFPDLPYECSWAFETEWINSYNREVRGWHTAH